MRKTRVVLAVLCLACLPAMRADRPGGGAWAQEETEPRAASAASARAASGGAAPLILAGIDGLEWNVMLPLIREGRLPTMAGLMERGVFGRLQTIRPTVSPAIWTTIATGKMPSRHGITGFAYPGPGGRDDPRLFTSGHRKVKAFWDIFSEGNLVVHTVGWWNTYPVEPVRGIMVAQTNTRDQIDFRGGRAIWKGGYLAGVENQVFPPSVGPRIAQIALAVEDSLDSIILDVFGSFPRPPGELGRRLWENTRWAFRADAIYRRVATEILASGEPFDLLAVYLGGTDVVGHRFWRYREPGLFRYPPEPAEAENFGRVIDDYYVYADRILGELIAAAGREVNVVVVSDHGMVPVNLEQEFPRDAPPEDLNSAAHTEAPPGILLAAGPNIRRGSYPFPPPAGARGEDLPVLGGVADVLPTLLVLAGLPVALDMDGVALGGLIDQSSLPSFPSPVIGSFDSEAWRRRRSQRLEESLAQEERLEQLRSLGYIR